MKTKRTAPALCAGIALCAMVTPALAANATTAPTAPETPEIIVTAQNRAQNVQDVPIAIQVISAQQVEKAGITDLSGIQRLSPAVGVTNDTNITRVTLRGVGTNDNSETQDQSIAVNVDGEYINRPTVLNAAIFDLERVEVLRGPQGTLYGRNATGGAINFISRKPGNTLAANGSVSYGNYNHVVAQGGVDLPLGDIGAVRVAATYSARDGYFKHPNYARATGDDNTLGGRISLRLQPAAGLKIEASAEHVTIDRVIASQASVNFNNGLAYNAAFIPGPGCNQNGWSPVGGDSRYVVCIPANVNALGSLNRGNYIAPARSPSLQDQKSTALRGKLTYDFGWATLSYIGGYRTTKEKFDAALAPAYLFRNFKNNVDTQSHELRLNGKTGGGIEWQAGAFRFQENLDVARGLFNGPPYMPSFLLGPNGGFINFFDRKVETGSWAIFGQGDIPVTEKLSAVVGGRYTWDKRVGVFNNYGGGLNNPASPLYNAGPAMITAAPLSIDRLTAQAQKFTWLLGLNYKPDAQTLVYGKVSTGFKAGGFDAVGAYKPETNTAYEMGLKRELGRRSFVNLSGFYYDYRDLQASVLLDSSIGGQVFNAGKATIWGIELDSSLKVFENGRLTASVNYLNAKYNNFRASYSVFCASETDTRAGRNCITGLGDMDSDLTANPVVQPKLDGNRPPQSPRWTIAVGYEHDFDLGKRGTITPSVFSRYKSSFFLDVFNYRSSRQQGFFQTDANIEWRHASKRFGVTAFIRNIENYRPLTYAGFTAAGNDDIYVFGFGAPRTFGLRLSVDM